jgi:hypothetical protein
VAVHAAGGRELNLGERQGEMLTPSTRSLSTAISPPPDGTLTARAG